MEMKREVKMEMEELVMAMVEDSGSNGPPAVSVSPAARPRHRPSSVSRGLSPCFYATFPFSLYLLFSKQIARLLQHGPLDTTRRGVFRRHPAADAVALLTPFQDDHGLEDMTCEGYDADSQTYTYRDNNDGSYWETEPGNRYGKLHKGASESPTPAVSMRVVCADPMPSSWCWLGRPSTRPHVQRPSSRKHSTFARRAASLRVRCSQTRWL